MTDVRGEHREPASGEERPPRGALAVSRANQIDAKQRVRQESLTLVLQVVLIAPFLGFALWRWGVWIALPGALVGVGLLAATARRLGPAAGELRRLEREERDLLAEGSESPSE